MNFEDFLVVLIPAVLLFYVFVLFKIYDEKEEDKF